MAGVTIRYMPPPSLNLNALAVGFALRICASVKSTTVSPTYPAMTVHWPHTVMDTVKFYGCKGSSPNRRRPPGEIISTDFSGICEGGGRPRTFVNSGVADDTVHSRTSLRPKFPANREKYRDIHKEGPHPNSGRMLSRIIRRFRRNSLRTEHGKSNEETANLFFQSREFQCAKAMSAVLAKRDHTFDFLYRPNGAVTFRAEVIDAEPCLRERVAIKPAG